MGPPISLTSVVAIPLIASSLTPGQASVIRRLTYTPTQMSLQTLPRPTVKQRIDTHAKAFQTLGDHIEFTHPTNHANPKISSNPASSACQTACISILTGLLGTWKLNKPPRNMPQNAQNTQPSIACSHPSSYWPGIFFWKPYSNYQYNSNAAYI